MKELPKNLEAVPRARKHFTSWSGVGYYEEMKQLWKEYQVCETYCNEDSKFCSQTLVLEWGTCLSVKVPATENVLKLVHISPEPGEKRLWKCHLPFINFIIVWALWHAQKWKLSSCKVDSLPSEGVTRFLFQKDKYRWSKFWSCLFCKFQE